MTFENPEKEREWLDHFQKVYEITLTERERVIYHFGFEDGERNQIRRVNAEKIRNVKKEIQNVHTERRIFSQGDPIQRLDDTPFQQGDPIEKL